MASRFAAAGGGLCLALSVLGIIAWLMEAAGRISIFADATLPPIAVLLSFAFMSFSLLTRLNGGRRWSLVLLAVGGAVAALALFRQHIVLETGSIADPIRPGASLLLALIGAALIPDTGKNDGLGSTALALATIALLLATTVALSYAVGASLDDMTAVMIMKLPAAILGICLAAGVVAWRYSDGWPKLLTDHARESVVDGWHVPGLIVAVAALQILVHSAARYLKLHPGVVDALVMVLNMTVATVLIGYAARRLAQRRAERDELVGVVDLAPVMVVGGDGIIRYWSRGCAELYGWSAHEALGRSRHDLLGTQMAEGRMWPGDIDDSEPFERETIERHRDGRSLAILDQVKAIQDVAHPGSTVNAITDMTGRREAEAALRAQETRLRTILDVHGLTAIEWDFERRAIIWSVNLDPRMDELPSDVAFEDLWASVGAEEAECAALGEAVNRARSGDKQHFQHYLTVRDGAEARTHRLSGRILPGAPQSPPRMIVACDDVTEERLREYAIQLTESRLATAVAVQDIFIYEYDLSAGRTRWSTGNELLFGRDENDGINVALRREMVAAVADRRSRVHFICPFQRSDGVQRHAESWARIVYDEGGRPLRIVGTHLDVTERVEREHALRAAEAEMRAILATVPDAMVVCSADGIIRSSSAATDILFGSAPGELVGVNILSIAGPSIGITQGGDLGELLRTAKRIEWPIRAAFTNRDGVEVPVSAVVSETTVDGQQLYVINVRDMRPAIEAEARMVRLRSELDQVSRAGMMGEMAAALAHEINQPLAAIVNFLGAADIMLQGASEHGAARDAVRSASEQATRAGEIIRRLRAFITRGEIDMRPELIAPLIEEAAALAMVNRGSLDVRIRYEFEDQERLVLGDRIQIQQVLVNLIRNGVDAMAAESGTRRELLVSTAMDGAMLMVSVHDNGPGMAPEMYDQLFRPFVTSKREGLGFGLSISRRIVEAHGGALSVSPRKRGGTTFCFTLATALQKERPA